jgi:hypothetical protein
MNPDERIRLLDRLQALLERQIQLAKEGNTDAVEDLAGQADSIVKQITRMRFLELPEFAERRTQIRQLYDALSLAVKAQAADASQKLARIRKGRKTIGVYRTNTQQNVDRVL